MPEIRINDLQELQPAGVEFFTENEGYLENLNEDEFNIWGGVANEDVVISIDNSNGFISIDDGKVVSLPPCIIRWPVTRWSL